MQNKIMFKIFIAFAFVAYSWAANTWPCINGKCSDGTTNCDNTKIYDCPPPTCTRAVTDSEECEHLACVASTSGTGFVCDDNFPQRFGAGNTCGRHSDCDFQLLCVNDKCASTNRIGTFKICTQKSDCVDPADPATKDQDCIKYRDQQMGASGVCVEPSLDPGNTVAPPGGMNDDPNADNRATNCAQNVALCNSEFYRGLMLQQCARTCRDAGVDLRCIDKHPNCRFWVMNGFCDETFYSDADKRQKCAKSCGKC